MTVTAFGETATRHCTNPLCGRELKPHEKRCHGWCPACYRRWNDGDRPPTGPPPPQKADREYMRVARAARALQACHLAAAGLAAAAIAERMGLHETTVRKYLAITFEGEQMSNLEGALDALYSSSGPQPPQPPPPVDVAVWRSGRALEEWEQAIVAAAREDARRRDMQMLRGAPMREVA